jgi:hypothetical protein
MGDSTTEADFKPMNSMKSTASSDWKAKLSLERPDLGIQLSEEERKMRSNVSIKNMDDLDAALQEGHLDDLAQKYSRAKFHDAASMPAVILMNHGRFEDLSYRDVEDLFTVLDEDGSGLLDFEEVALLLAEVLDPACTMEQIDLVYDLTEQQDAGVTVDELYRALTSGPVKEHLKRLQRENRLKHQFEQALGINAQVDRDLMVKSLKNTVEKDDAFKTLPHSMVSIGIFIFLVVAHLKVFPRQQVERGLVNWLTGYGQQLDGPYFKEHISDVGTTFDWLKASGLPAILGVCQEDTEGYSRCHVGTKNLLLGDIQMRQTKQDGSEAEVWLLHSPQAVQFLSSSPAAAKDYLGAATAAIDHLKAAKWADADTNELEIRFTTYGKQSNMFAVGAIQVSFDDFGISSERVVITSVPVKAYPPELGLQVFFILMDVLYCINWVIPMIKELKDMCHLMRISGLSDGFLSYWGLWNFVDWVSICMGVAVTVIWLLICMAMEAEEIIALLIEDGSEWVLTPRAMLLDVTALEIADTKFADISSLFFTMHIVMGGATVSIMLKFFKAFQANPRLQLVTNTLVRAGSDIFHFLVVFSAVFLGFAVTGHILLGNDLVQFRSFAASIDTCFIVLMGEFGWYEGVSTSDNGLESGLPYIILMLWFWSYMVFVLLIMINMLLAIILEHYTELVHEVSQDSDAVTLWKQTAQYIHQARKTRDHIPLAHLLCELEDDDTPCHQEKVVTTDSLSCAFPKMKYEQVAHLHTWLKDQARRSLSSGDDELIARLKAVGQYVEHLASDIHVVKLNVAVCTSRLRESFESGLLGGVGPSPRISRRPSGRKSMSGRATDVGSPSGARKSTRISGRGTPMAGMAGGGDMQEQVEMLTQKISDAIQQMSWQIGGATDKLLSQGSALESAAEEALRAQPPQVNGNNVRSNWSFNNNSNTIG